MCRAASISEEFFWRLLVTIFDVAALSFDGHVITTPVATFPPFVNLHQNRPECSWPGYWKGKLLGVREHSGLRSVDARCFQGEARQSIQFIGVPATGKPAAQILSRKVAGWRPPHCCISHAAH
jgi:hypothetical protein